MTENNQKNYSKQEVEKATLQYFNNDGLATDVWIKKYCLKDEKNYYELTPDDMHRRIAKELARIEAKYPNPLSEEEIFETLKEFKRIIPQGSPMSGIGNDFQVVSLSNCFVIGNEDESDSYGGILKIDQEQIQLMKRRGGVGHDLSHIRPAGSPVKNSAITSTGIVPFMERYSNSTKEVAQDGRRGALMLTLSVIHPDAEKFIDAKLEQGKVTGANISVKIDDEFMDAVINEKPFLQRYPINLFKTMSEQEDATMYLLPMEELKLNGEFNKMYPVKDKQGKVLGYVKKINPSKLWKKIIYNAWKSAEPGILFWNTIMNESVPDSYADLGFKTVSTNPCFSGKENLLTTQGNKTFEELCGIDNLEIINSAGNIVTSKVWHSGERETIKFSNTQNESFICTPDHVWKTIENDEIEAKDLKGRKLMPFLFEKITHNELFVKLGFIQGDGNLGRLKSNEHKGFEINISKDDDEVLNYFGFIKKDKDERKFYLDKDNDLYTRDFFNTCLDLKFSAEQLPLRNLPETINSWSESEQLSFLSGLFSANGSVVGNYRIAFKSTNKNLILQIQKLLKKFDIDSYYTTNKSKMVSFSNGEYQYKESYDLNIGKYYDLIKFFNRIKFIHRYKNNKLRNVILDRTPKITKIEDNGVIDVYDFNEPENNWGVVNGYIAHNCGEITLCPDDSCRLLALNLYGYVNNPFTPNAKFDWVRFENDVVTSQRYMDDIIDLEIEKIDKIIEKVKSDPEDEFIKMYEIKLWERIKDKAIRGRRTGLGVTAEGDMLAAMGLRYGTDEATDFSEEVHKQLKLNAYHSSIIMAKERGAFPIYDTERELNNPFILRIKKEAPSVYNDMVKYGRRNIALLTIAPTGTVSLMTQTTSGIEPAFQVFYKRRRKINPQEKDVRIDFVDDDGIAWTEYAVFHHKFENWLEVNGYDINVVKSMSEEQLNEIIKKSPYYKATANDVDWVKKVEMQGRVQKNVDHSISVTVNLPEDITEEMVASVYETAWKSGCKGITVYRDSSRSGVLITKNEKKEEPSEIHVPKRPKRLKAEIHRFQNNLEKWIAVVGLKDGKPFEIFTGKNENGLTYLPSNIKNCEVVKNIFELEEINDEGKTVKVRKKRYDIEYVDNNGDKQVHTGLNHAFNPEFWNYAKFISAVLRHKMPMVHVYELINSLNFSENNINTWKNGIARTVKRYIKDGEKIKSTCPECGSEHLEFKEGCLTCMACGNSKCG